MSNTVVQLFGMLSAILGWVVLNFMIIIYVSVKKLGGTLERRHIYVLASVTVTFFVSAAILTLVGISA